ncbi:F0F1 ATP synthase subunit epsilon [Thalassobius sp. MITS945101]|uniref:F0F1 ATP synthase subunit epsilon n=1 Tax=Thalassobius sp. MITS945101 TaxID=3096994 RepID=UPI00399A9D31
MAETVQFDLVSPERSLASLMVEQVQIPGADGDMTAMAGHAPTITTLRPGLLSVSGPNGSADYVVTGGFAEIGQTGISVLAESAIAREDVTADDLSGMIAAANEALEAAKANGGQVDDAAKLVSDLEAIGAQIGLSV